MHLGNTIVQVVFGVSGETLQTACFRLNYCYYVDSL